MVSGIINIALGVTGIVLGVQGRVLAFTNSKEALIGLGGVMVALGCYQIFRSRRRGL